MDIVFLKELRIDTIIGIYEWERQVRQIVVLDIEMASDNLRAAPRRDSADPAYTTKVLDPR